MSSPPAVRDRPLSELRPWPRNPRRISPARLEQLKRSLLAEPEMLVARPLIALPDGTVIAGNQRLRAALDLGWVSLPVVTVDLDAGRAAEWALRDNAGYGADDELQLGLLLAELAGAGRDLELTGLDSAAVDALLAGVREPPPVDPDEVPAAPVVPRSVRGVVYELGPHRVMCGDATSEGDVAALLAENEPLLLLTDPPYGVAYDPEWRDAAQAIRLGRGRKRIDAGDDEPVNWTSAITLAPCDVAYCWAPGGAQQYLTQQFLEASGYRVRQQIVWVKPMAPLSRSHYHWRHEPCWYAVREGATAHWIAGRSETTVWEVASPLHIMGGSDEQKTPHPTQKPAELYARPLRNHSGDVYDPFAGSGTAVVACEQAHRRCFAMEINPGYVDVIRQRYADYTGQPHLAP